MLQCLVMVISLLHFFFVFTLSSYAQLNQKSLDLKAHQEEMEHFMQDITSATNAVECHYVLMKVVYSIEEIISKKSKMYWPSEISLAAFSLKGGLKSVYTQLIDTSKFQVVIV